MVYSTTCQHRSLRLGPDAQGATEERGCNHYNLPGLSHNTHTQLNITTTTETVTDVNQPQGCQTKSLLAWVYRWYGPPWFTAAQAATAENDTGSHL